MCFSIENRVPGVDFCGNSTYARLGRQKTACRLLATGLSRAREAAETWNGGDRVEADVFGKTDCGKCGSVQKFRKKNFGGEAMERFAEFANVG